MNIKTNLKILTIFTCLATGAGAYAQVGFIRPELSYNLPTISVPHNPEIRLRDAFGYSVNGGVLLGTQNENEIGLSVGILNFPMFAHHIQGVTAFSGKVKTIPIMANYRYYFGTKADPVRFYLAPSLAYTRVQIDATTNGPSGFAWGRSTSTDFTWAGGLGVLIKVAARVDLDVGYRYQGELKEAVTGTEIRMHTVYAGVNVRF
jgi:opacity protein-like surface antigen